METISLGEQIKNKLKAENMSVPELAAILEVPKDRIYGGNGTDHVTLIDQNNKKQDAVVNPSNPTIVSLPSCYAVDSFVIKVYR